MLIRGRGTDDSTLRMFRIPKARRTFLDSPGHRVKNKNYKTQFFLKNCKKEDTDTVAYETISPLYLKFNDVILSMINMLITVISNGSF